MSNMLITISCLKVALRKESVDRNNGLWDSLFGNRTVALRKESVDRNISSCC